MCVLVWTCAGLKVGLIVGSVDVVSGLLRALEKAVWMGMYILHGPRLAGGDSL